MKNAIPTIICIFMLCYGNFNAQNYSGITTTNEEKTTSNLTSSNNPMPDWEKYWTKESVIAINEIIEEHGYPDENSPNRMHWTIPGEVNKTITYTENFLFDLPFEPYSCDNDSVAFMSKNHL